MELRCGCSVWLAALMLLGLGLSSAEVTGPYRIQSLNYPLYKFGISAITDEAPAAIMEGGRRFLIHSPGLTGAANTVSIEAVDWPGHYLRHRGEFLYVDLKSDSTTGFEDEATFTAHNGLLNKGYLTFEAVNRPGHYIRHSGYKLHLHTYDNTAIYKADASFRYLEGPYLMQSENMKDHVLGINGQKDAAMRTSNGLLLNFVTPGMTGVAGTVSLESHIQPGFYLRHYGYLVDLENRQSPRNPGLFEADGTFKLCKTGCYYDGYISLEAANMPGFFLRHANFRVKMSSNDNTELFKHDASFKFIDSPSYIESYDYPGYRVDMNSAPGTKLTLQGHQFLLVYPGLARQPGSVSLESIDTRGKYLRVTNDMKIGVADGLGENEAQFRRKATFLLRDSPWFANTLTFESVSDSGNYIQRHELGLRILDYQNVDSYKATASFLRTTREPQGPKTDLGASLIQSYNYPDYTFGLTFDKQEAYIRTNGKRFLIRSPGINGQADSISFVSPDRPDTFLRQYGGLLVSETRFQPRNPINYLNEATFIPRQDKWYPGYYGFEAANVRNGFIRHSGYRLMVSVNDNSELFKQDASFRRIEGPYLLQSLNYPQNKIGLTSNNQALMTQSGHPWYFIHPGLTFDNGSISLESSEIAKSYLRHYGFLLDLENIDNPRNKGIFRQDASFYLQHGRFAEHYFALESVNMADHYVRHQNARVKASPRDETQLFKEDASFRSIQGPFLLESHNYRGYGLSVDNTGTFYIGRGGTKLQFVFPGLTAQAGSVSVEISGMPGIYLRHEAAGLQARRLDKATDMEKFKADATWWLRDELFCEGCLHLESVNKPNYFLRHQNSKMKISEYKDEDVFKKDASFLRVSELRSQTDIKTTGPYMLQSYASPDRFVNIELKPNNNQERRAFVGRDRGARLFIQEPGLANQSNSISFLSANRPNHYLRHHRYTLDMEGLEGSRNPHIFDLDATYVYAYREDAQDLMLFESVNYPTYFMSAYSDDLRLVKSNGSKTLRDLASFRLVQGPYYMESLVQPNRHLRVTTESSGQKFKVSASGNRFYMSTPGLSGVKGTVSLSLADSPRLQVCISSTSATKVTTEDRYEIDKLDTTARAAAAERCSFKVNNNINFAADRFFALESLKHVNHYLSLDKIDSDTIIVKKSLSGGHIAMDEAGFRFILGPLMLHSYNNPDVSMNVGSPPGREVSLSVNGTSLVLVVPGLNGDPGTTSLQVAGNRSLYLRHYGYLLHAEDRATGRNPDLFNEDASFVFRDDLWYEKTLALESVNYGSHYLHHDNLRVRITESDDTKEQYRKDASFTVREVIPTEEPTEEPPEETLSMGGQVGVAIGTILVALLFMALLVGYERIAAVFCKRRMIARKEGRYDTMDGFDNPIYATNTQDLTLMYSPQGGVKMVDNTKASSTAAAPQSNGMAHHHDQVDGGSAVTGLNSNNDIYVDMNSLNKKDPAKKSKTKSAIPNPLYEAEHQYPGIATQSSVELFVDDHHNAVKAMADSGLPGMSNLDMLADLRHREDGGLPTIVESQVKEADESLVETTPTQDQLLQLDPRSLQPTPIIPQQPPAVVDYGTDNTDEYVAPTSPIFFGLRPSDSVPPSSTTTPPPLDTGFASVDLLAPTQPAMEGFMDATLVAATGTTATTEEVNMPQKEGPPATVSTTEMADIDSDIPDTYAPPVPYEAAGGVSQEGSQNQGEEEIYSYVPLTKKPKEKPKEVETVIDLAQGRNDSELAPPLPPRSYDPDAIGSRAVQDPDEDTSEVVPSEKKLKIIYDDDPDAIYASIDYEPTTPVDTNVPPVLPPFPLDTPEGIIPPFYSQASALPAAESLADVTNGVLGPKGEIIPLPTRKHSKSNLLDLLSNVFSSEDEEKVTTERKKKKKKEKLPISIVNPLYDFDNQDSGSTNELEMKDTAIGNNTGGEPSQEVVEHIPTQDSEDDEEREEKAYNKLVEQKTLPTSDD